MQDVCMTKDEAYHIILGPKMKRPKECSDQVCVEEKIVPVIPLWGIGLSNEQKPSRVSLLVQVHVLESYN